MKIIGYLIWAFTVYFVGKINGYNEGYIDGRFEEKIRRLMRKEGLKDEQRRI